MDFEPPMVNCDFDYDGFAGASGDQFLKWNGVRYTSVDEVLRESLLSTGTWSSSIQPPPLPAAFCPQRITRRFTPLVTPICA